MADEVMVEAPAIAPEEFTKAQKHGKLQQLPKNYKILKRPLVRPAIPTPFTDASHPKIVFVKHQTPFISAVKRVRGLLKNIEKRDQQSFTSGKGHLIPKKVEAEIAAAQIQKKGPKEEVFVKSSGRAIEKALSIALYFQQQNDCRVRITTGTIETVDDIDRRPSIRREQKAKAKRGDKNKTDGKPVEEALEEMAVATDEDPDQENGGVAIEDGEWSGKIRRDETNDGEIPETRIRKLNVIEVAISLR
ncbi:hypothetical protein K432DRAFT_303000 [Lepidopterella palustris CBS 459.81]|uniref:Uncharacterized protein n=1 Tax=Lepidopterella palustris CBS 459.81 TaxID=1314670 RepID=A0A8E2E5W9_9PEZI|nr:hypothetical protein K432DRAFT_303000 [Lepidopterella palustris CBS 459.81]